MKIMVVILVLFSGSIALGVSQAMEQEFYQWRDSNNVLHVSQLPPKDVEYQTIVVGSKSAGTTALTKTVKTDKAAEEIIESCRKARENLQVLQQDLPVYLDLEDGSKELLDDSKRAEQKQLAEKQIQFYCDKTVNQAKTPSK